MANLKDIKTRITSVKKTKQITAAMKLVAGAKLKRATDAATGARPYQAHLADVLQRVAASTSGDANQPLLEAHERIQTILVVVITSDRGLCGGFNNTLLRRAHEFIEQRTEAGQKVEIALFGRKAKDFMTARNIEVGDAVLDWAKSDKMALVRPIADRMVSGYAGHDFDEVHVISNLFVSTLVQTPKIDRVLPFEVPEADASSASAEGEYRFEPGAEEILGNLLPLYIRTLLLQKFLETEAGEHAARMTAMDSATRNAADLIDNLTLDYNRARQAAITTELIEIVSGASAL